MKLSLCIAVFNEEQNIHYPLDSAYDFVDEVVIVDGGSTDKAVEKARSYGKKVKIFIEPNPPMFHINKQKAIEQAKGEWILQLDADEEISNELKEEIQIVVNKNWEVGNKKLDNEIGSGKNRTSHIDFPASNLSSPNSGQVAFRVPRKNYFLTRFLMKGGQYPDYTIRLYRNGYARFPLKSVHENVEVKGNIGYLKNPIFHYADPNFSRYLKRWDRYTSLEAEQLLSEKKLNISISQFLNFFFVKPCVTFFSMYFRHLGFLDGFPGFVFALFSSIRFWAIYIKLFVLKNP